MCVTLTLGPYAGVNRSDRTSSSSRSTGTFHTHAEAGDGGGGVGSDVDWLPKASPPVTTETLVSMLELARRTLPRSLLRSSSTARPTLAGLQPTEAERRGQSLESVTYVCVCVWVGSVLPPV